MSERRVRAADRRNCAATGAVWASALLIAAGFVWLLADVTLVGAPRLSLEFFTAAPRDAGRAGGIAPILVSTALIVGVCLAAALPIGLGTAVLLSESTAHEGPLGRVVRRSLDLLAGVPSIVFGLFGNAFFCVFLGLGFSVLSGGLTLACMVLPIFIRTAEESLRAVPAEYRLGAAALGFTRATTIFRVLLPVAAPGLGAALVLSIGRALAETAALVFTSGYAARMPASLLDSGRAISVHVYDLSVNVAGGEANAHGTALVLVMALLAINQSTWLLTHRFLRQGMTPP